jgi:hypothetical protein
MRQGRRDMMFDILRMDVAKEFLRRRRNGRYLSVRLSMQPKPSSWSDSASPPCVRNGTGRPPTQRITCRPCASVRLGLPAVWPPEERLDQEPRLRPALIP